MNPLMGPRVSCMRCSRISARIRRSSCISSWACFRVKRLVVNADDFGFTRDVNQGIVEAHRDGILTATTLMATGAAFEDAVRLARAHPSLDIGVHLVLVGDPPFPRTVAQLARAVALRRIPIYEELLAQVRRILD